MVNSYARLERVSELSSLEVWTIYVTSYSQSPPWHLLLDKAKASGLRGYRITQGNKRQLLEIMDFTNHRRGFSSGAKSLRGT